MSAHLDSRRTEEKDFVPKGAMAFFIAVLLFMASVWLIVYWIMIERAG